MNRNLVTAFASVAGSRVAKMVASLVITPLIVWQLTPSEYGQYATVMAVFGLVMILTSSGINTGVRKYIAEQREQADWTNSVFGFYFRIAALLSVVVAAMLVVAAETGLISATLGDTFVSFFYLLAGLAILAQFRSYLSGALMGLQLEHLAEPINVGRRIVFGVFAITLAATGYGVLGVLAGHLIADVLVIAVLLAYLSGRVSLSSPFRSTSDSFPARELIDFGGVTIVVLFLLRTFYHVDVLVLQYFTAGSEQVGYYRAALVLSQLLWLVPRSLQAVMVQSTSELWRNDDVDRIENIAARTTRYSLLLTVLLALGLGVLAVDFVPIYFGPEYAAAVPPLLVLLPGTVGFALARPVFAINHTKGRLGLMVATTGFAAMVNLAFNLLLIPRYGMIGAALGSTIGYASLPVVQFWLARRLGYRPLTGARPGRIAATTVLTAAVLVPLSMVLDGALLSLAVVPPVGLLVYTVAALGTGALDLEEVFEVAAALPPPISGKVDGLRKRIEHADGLLSSIL